MRRRLSKQIRLRGGLVIGGSSPVSVQGMTNRPLSDVAGNIEQIESMRRHGASLVRLAVRTLDEAEFLPQIIRESSIPLCADIHFDYRIALKAIDGGIQKIRLNPGNIGSKERVEEVVIAARQSNVPIRIGVNGGSVDKKKFPYVTSEALVESAMEHVRILEDLNYNEIVVSIKSSDVIQTVEANRLLARTMTYPIHVGLTEAGYGTKCIIQSSAAIGALLLDGIGDTIRVSMTGDPVKEIPVAREILKSCGLLREGIKIVSCPTCGRTDTSINLEDIAEKADIRLSSRFGDILAKKEKMITVAVMGCEVNGPGEASHADIGLAGARNGEFILFASGEMLRRVKADVAVDELCIEAEKIISSL